jgi:hypothetical protein
MAEKRVKICFYLISFLLIEEMTIKKSMIIRAIKAKI